MCLSESMSMGLGMVLALSSSLCRPHLVFLPHSVFLWVCSLAYTIAY